MINVNEINGYLTFRLLSVKNILKIIAKKFVYVNYSFLHL